MLSVKGCKNMEGRELRRSYTQFDFSTNRHQNHQQINRARHQNGVSGPATINSNKQMKNKTPSIEIYRPPGQRSELDNPKQLNVHAKEFVMSNSPNSLQTSRSTGNILLNQISPTHTSMNNQMNNSQHVMNLAGSTHHSILLPSAIKHSPSNKNVRWEDGKSRGSVGGGLVRSKSMVSSQSRNQDGRISSGGVADITTGSKDSVITPLGPLSRTQYANIKHAIDGTGKLNSEDTMGVVKVLIDRAMESRNYANVIATACEKIIDRESSQANGSSMFLESLINYSQYSLNKLKENSVNRKFNGIMAFVCELYIMLKSKTLLRDAKWGLVSPSQWLLKLLAKCCHEVLQDPHLHMKPDQVESLFLTMTMVGRDLEKELPQNMDSLMSSIRDSFLMNSRLSQTIKHTLLQIIEIHAACWQLPAFTLMYYKGSPHLVQSALP